MKDLHPSEPPTLYVFNIRAATKPYDVEQLATNLAGYGVDVAVLTKTRLKKKHNTSVVAIDGFKLICQDRLARKGGGVAVYIRK